MSKWERRSRKTAALLAAWTAIAGNSVLAASATAAKRSSCSSKKRESGSSAVAKWVQTPASSRIGTLGAGTQQVQHLGRIAVAEPAHAAVVLDVDPGRAAMSAGARGDEVEETASPGGHLGARLECRVQLLWRQRSHRQQGDVGEATPDPLGLDGGRHRQPRCAAGQGGLGAGDVAVPVAVGLDHRAELRLAQLGLEPRAVVPHRAEIDPGNRPRPAHSSTSAASASARVTMPTKRPSSSTTGRWLW